MHSTPQTHLPADIIEAPWASLIPDDQWAVFTETTEALRGAGITALLGGAMALATYTQRWRNTKDIDVFIAEADRERAIQIVHQLGFEDYYPQLAYDRSWIFRAFRDGVLFDIIWDLPNHRVDIDKPWFERAQAVRLRNTVHSAVPVEELIRVKLYVMQRERCDWVDVLNVLAGAHQRIDWEWLVRRMGRDLPLLHGVLAIFNWASPARAARLPDWVRAQFALPVQDTDDPEAAEVRRVRLFDSRPWFAMHQAADQPLER